MVLFGNYVVIDHGNGEFSHLGHLKPGSVKVAAGDKVRAGQPIAQVGTSGSSLFPHLHYELATTAGTDGEGVPSQFVEFDRVLGATRARAEARARTRAISFKRAKGQVYDVRVNARPTFRLATPAERSALEELQRRASLIWEEDRDALLAHPDAIELPLEQITDGHTIVAESIGRVTWLRRGAAA